VQHRSTVFPSGRRARGGGRAHLHAPRRVERALLGSIDAERERRERELKGEGAPRARARRGDGDGHAGHLRRVAPRVLPSSARLCRRGSERRRGRKVRRRGEYLQREAREQAREKRLGPPAPRGAQARRAALRVAPEHGEELRARDCGRARRIRVGDAVAEGEHDVLYLEAQPVPGDFGGQAADASTAGGPGSARRRSGAVPSAESAPERVRT